MDTPASPHGHAGVEIVRVPVLSDNYAWLVHDPASGETAAVDPGEAEPVLAAAAARGWRIEQVWATHWHLDHVGGIAAIKERTGARVTGPAAEAERIPGIDSGVAEGDLVALGDHRAEVWDTPGHTAGHVSLHFAKHAALFTGDTLFAMGCGRLFEGTPAQMFANMQRFRGLPDDTRVFCGHEYTQTNGRFALTAEPGNAAISERMVEVDALRARGEATVPTTIGQERATNPFLRAASAEQLAGLREAKDRFRV